VFDKKILNIKICDMISQRSISFAKYSGTGNDFILIDNRNNIFKKRNELLKFVKLACIPKLGIGADGVILIEKSEVADFKMRIFNPDGSEPEMCGNGARCGAHYAFVLNYVKKKMTIETLAGVISAEIKSKYIVKVKLSKPHSFQDNIKIKYKNKSLTAYHLNTGVPHTIIYSKNLEKEDVINLGRFIRYHKIFEPAGTNVDFVKVINNNSIEIRTYERGVENETLACGTGASASAIISGILKKVKSPVSVKTKSGEILKVYFKIFEDNQIDDVFLEGKVIPIFSGVTEFDGKRLFVE